MCVGYPTLSRMCNVKNSSLVFIVKDRNIWLAVIQMLKKKEQLPVVAFTLSKKKCDANADMVRSSDLVTATERSHITSFFNKSMSKLKGSDRELPQVSYQNFSQFISSLLRTFMILAESTLINNHS